MLDKQLKWSESFSAQLLAPRLSVMITSIDLAGRVNAAPYSFFMPVSYIPTRVCFSVVHIKHHSRLGFHYAKKQSPEEMLQLEQFAAETEETLKDTLANIMEQGQFGINILPIEYLHQVILASHRYPRGVDEIEISGLTAFPSIKIKPPLIKEANVAVECEKIKHVDIGSGPEKITLIIGEALAWHIDSKIMQADEINPERMGSLLQFSASAFGACTDVRYEDRQSYPDVIPMPRK